LGAALLVRLAVVGLTHDSYRLRDDPADYHRLGVSLAGGHGFAHSVVAAGDGPTAFRPPLYPLTLGAVYTVAGHRVVVARVVQAVVGTITVALLGVLAGLLWDRRVALVAMGLAAIYPAVVLTDTALL